MDFAASHWVAAHTRKPLIQLPIYTDNRQAEDVIRRQQIEIERLRERIQAREDYDDTYDGTTIREE